MPLSDTSGSDDDAAHHDRQHAVQCNNPIGNRWAAEDPEHERCEKATVSNNNGTTIMTTRPFPVSIAASSASSRGQLVWPSRTP